MNQDVQTIADFIREQMDGQQVPPDGSKALEQLTQAVGNLLRHNSTRELEFLGSTLLGVVIERARSSVAAQATLKAFIRPGGGHD